MANSATNHFHPGGLEQADSFALGSHRRARQGRRGPRWCWGRHFRGHVFWLKHLARIRRGGKGRLCRICCGSCRSPQGGPLQFKGLGREGCVQPRTSGEKCDGFGPTQALFGPTTVVTKASVLVESRPFAVFQLIFAFSAQAKQRAVVQQLQRSGDPNAGSAACVIS